MSKPTRPSSAVWSPADSTQTPVFYPLEAALTQTEKAFSVLWHDEVFQCVEGGLCHSGEGKIDNSYPLYAHLPAVLPESLGCSSFCFDHGLRYPYYAGSMAFGISSLDLVAALGKAGMLGFFGSGGLPITALKERCHSLAQMPFPKGMNLLHRPDDYAWEEAVVDLCLHYNITLVEASAFLRATPALVRYRLAGIHRDSEGTVHCPNKLFAKVSRIEVAAVFMKPPPEKIVLQLLREGQITDEQADLAASIPLAQSITVEADSGGHTDHRSAMTLFPAIKTKADQIALEQSYARPLYVGLGGGIGTPMAAAAAFSLGADYIVTASVNQATVESGTSGLVKEILAQVKETDLRDAPAADLFERGGTVQVVGKGLRFAGEAKKLYDWYGNYNALEELPDSVVAYLESQVFKQSLAATWEECTHYLKVSNAPALDRAAKDQHYKLALLFRWYLGNSIRWALQGEKERRDDFQIWCGPSMGAFNIWAQGSYLEEIEQRRAPDIALQFLYGAARIMRLNLLRAQGIKFRPSPDWFKARPQGEM